MAEETKELTTPSYAVPRVDIRADKEAYVVELEMPGVPKEGLEITVDQHELIVVGRRKNHELKGELVHREGVRSDYRRAFELDPSVDVDKIHARLENGIVTLTLPKAERVKPRRIEVTAA